MVLENDTDKRIFSIAGAYIKVVKPNETLLLVFIGMATAIVAGGGRIGWPLFLFLFLALLTGSAGVNGITNYIDRYYDARMTRTRMRPLPSGRIFPAWRSLPWTLGLTSVGLAISWFLDPLAFIAGCIGVTAAVTARKTWATHWLGIVSSIAPGVIGWTAVTHSLDATIALICLLIVIWVPMHVWSLMLAYRDDYRQADIVIFPLTVPTRIAVVALFGLSILLSITSIALYFVGGFSLFYLVSALILSLIVILASRRLIAESDRKRAWHLYKLSAYPYLGVIFLVMMIDRWISLL